MKHIEANSGTRLQLVGKGSNTNDASEEEGPLCIRITAADQQSAEAAEKMAGHLAQTVVDALKEVLNPRPKAPPPQLRPNFGTPVPPPGAVPPGAMRPQHGGGPPMFMGGGMYMQGGGGPGMGMGGGMGQQPPHMMGGSMGMHPMQMQMQMPHPPGMPPQQPMYPHPRPPMPF